jgi:opacity protein-like surface antigen
VRTSCPFSREGSKGRWTVLLALLVFGWLSTLVAGSAAAQDWGYEDDGWSQPTIRNDAPQPDTGWAIKMGLGFTDDPNTFLLYLEAPYSFDQWVSIGPAIQIGIDDHNTIVAPTANLTVTVPIFDRLRPYIFTGVGFAYLAEDGIRGDDGKFGFLINSGVGLEYQLSQRLALGSQMIFNFFPNQTLGKDLYYAWQVAGVRIAF